MSNIICSFVDFVFINEIQQMNSGESPILKASGVWKRINAVEKPVYQSNVKQNDAGPTTEETITVKAKQNNLVELLIQYCGYNTVLKIGTYTGDIFYVGNLEYPCSLEFTSDKIFDNYTFKAISPV